MIRVGIVGTGGMGTVHYHNYQHIDDAEVVAVVGGSEKSRQRASDWNVTHYSSIDQCAQSEDIDVFDICTPTYLHKQHVMEALSNNKHAITEKPIALNRKDAEEMYALADRIGKRLFVGQVLQFTKEIEVLRGLVQSEEYGQPLDAHFERLSACPRWVESSWLFEREKSGLIPFDLHIHDLDVIVSLFGKPSNFSFTSCKGRDKSYEEHFRFLYNYDDLHICAEAAWFNADIPFTAHWRVYFENALLVNDGESLTAYQFDHDPRVFDTEEELKISTGINLPPTGMFHKELSHFMDCIRKGVPSDKVTRVQVLTVVELLEEITKTV
jgi:predicted dehydrogenase